VEAALASPADSPATDDKERAQLKERLRLVRGVLYFRLNDSFKARMWQQRRTIKDLDLALHEVSPAQAPAAKELPAFEQAARRLALSGTPFRSDVQAIPFVRYADDEAVADYEYGYADALRDGGVVRPVYFPRIDGMMEWSAPDGSVHAHSFEDALDATRASQRLPK